MSARARLIVFLVSSPVVAFAVIGGFLGNASAREDAYQHLRVFEDVVSLILNNYVEDVDTREVMLGALRGLSEGLDPDSAFLRPEQVRRVESGAALPAGEVGVELTRQYYLRIVAARDGSPAARAGLRPGDYIRLIDRKPTRDLSVFEGTRLLRGAPGSKVALTIIRGNAAEPHEVTLVREKIGAPNITARVAAPGVGYLRIAEFGPSIAREVTSRVAELARDGASRLVIDVRGTAEGDLDSGITAARLFVRHGTLAIREDRGDTRETFTAEQGDGRLTLPTVLLANRGTAGAAELFVSALQGNERAEVIGERTLGRAAIQTLVKLTDGSGLWLSTSRYLAPGGAAIHEQGLEPDLEVDEPDVEFGGPPPETDPALERALERLANHKAAA